MKLILGTMTFGPQVNVLESIAMANLFLENGFCELDTAFVYNNGNSEEIVGEILKSTRQNALKVATKVNPRVTGRLDSESIANQLDISLERMQVSSIDTLYLHFPDPNTPLETTLEAVAEQYQLGKFSRLGLSNYPAWEVVHIWHLCKANGWPLPRVYQGLYNAFSRNVESELMPALKQLDISFYAYNPLAGGILAGKYSGFEATPSEGRFTHRPNYKERYWKKSYFEALEILQGPLALHKVSLIESALRWMIHHSDLDFVKGDALVLGVSSIVQLEQNLEAIVKGPLDLSIAQAYEEAWAKVQASSPSYFRTP